MAKKRTHEDYIKDVNDITNGEIEVLGEFKGVLIKILHKHVVCGYEWEIRPSHILNGSSCPKCSFKNTGKAKRKTHEEYVKRVYELHNGEFEVLGEYTLSKTKILHKHVVCGYEWEVVSSHILKGGGCPKCSFKNTGKAKRKTHEEYVKRVYELHNGEIEVLGEYTLSKTKIKHKHVSCGHVWDATPNSILSGHGCAECYGVKQKEHSQYVEEVNRIHNGEIKVLEEYKGVMIKIKHKHICGYEWDVFASSVLSGNGCPKCGGNARRTQQDYIREVREKNNGDIEVLGVYKNANTKIKHRHVICGHEWEAIPYSILNGGSCPKCHGKMLKTQEDYESQVQEKHNGEIEVLGKYSNSNTKIKHRHVICGHEWEATPGHILYGKSCPKCAGCHRRTHEEYVEEVEEKHNGEIEVLGRYKNIKTKITHKHICGYEWDVVPYSILKENGTTCPKCNKSKGETKVMGWLEYHQILFIDEYKFDNLVGINGSPLRFDFAVFKDDKLHSLIEYDGEFHYFDLYEGCGHKMIKKHDKLKNQYCLENKINLIRIPYHDFDNIEEILEYELKYLMNQMQPA